MNERFLSRALILHPLRSDDRFCENRYIVLIPRKPVSGLEASASRVVARSARRSATRLDASLSQCHLAGVRRCRNAVLKSTASA
jgi:hypothetical protein